jgi:ATP-dependent DNA helicase RecG
MIRFEEHVTGPAAHDMVERILAQAESRTLEFKRVSGRMVSKALETICAMANTEGGVLVLGKL